MAEKEGWLGSVGPFLYEDTDTDVYTDAVPLEGFRVAQGYVEDAPTEDYHISRKSYVDGLIAGHTPQLPVGWAPFVYPMGFSFVSAYTTALTLPADGGCVAIPMSISSRFRVISVTVRNLDTATERTWGWSLYLDASGGSNTIARVLNGNGNSTFTPIAASNQGLIVETAANLAPGVYWLVIQNRHATSTFDLGTIAAGSVFIGNLAQTKTIVNPCEATLDMVAATWTKISSICAVRMNCRVFGASTIF